MKKPLRTLCGVLCLLLAFQLLSGCGENEMGSSEKQRETAGFADETEKNLEMASGALEEASSSTLSEEMGPEAKWRELTREELDSLTDSLDWSVNGFFVTAYSRPEEIDWNEVFYNGAGRKRNPSESELAEYENAVGPVITSLVCIERKDVEEFVWEKTGMEYSAARHPLQWYLTESGLYMTQHGDTNARPVRFSEGTVLGNEYRLTFSGTDYVNYRFERDFVISVRIEEGRWLFRSCLPADAPSPLDLLEIRYAATEMEAAALGAEEFYQVQQLPSDEPFGWCWAVLTAKQDGVRFVVERLRAETDKEQIFSDTYGLVLPGGNVTSGVLNRGESVAIWVNRPWHPRIRLIASKGTYYGDYVFGEDNWLHLEDTVIRYVIGHDWDGEGRGTSWSSEEDLVNFLNSGSWEYKNEESGETLAAVCFSEYRSMVVDNGEDCYKILLQYSRIYSEEDQAPDLLQMNKYFSDDSCWEPHSFIFSQERLGDYLVSAIQLDGEQILTLQQVNNGDGILNAILPQTEQNQHVFRFYRYAGTAAAEGQGG